tara:strand:- start:454 stop:714 length:261 start_codon:yes stop_codon:yes gene_type:complete
MYSENSDFDFGLMIALDESYDDETNFEGFVFCTDMKAEKFSSLQDKMLDMFLENHNINTKKLIDNVKDILNKDKDGEDESASPQNN